MVPSFRRVRPCFVVFFLLIARVTFGADPPAVSAARLPAGTAAPVVDGLVTDEAWKAVAPLDTFTQQDPIDGAPASGRTEVRVLLDRTTIYVGIVCFDSEPDKIIVSQARRDSPLTDVDSIIVVLDTF